MEHRTDKNTRDFSTVEERLELDKIIKGIIIPTRKHYENLNEFFNVLDHAIAHTIVIIGDEALVVLGGLNLPQYLRIRFKIPGKLPSSILFNPVINLNPRGLLENYKQLKVHKTFKLVNQQQTVDKFDYIFIKHCLRAT